MQLATVATPPPSPAPPMPALTLDVPAPVRDAFADAQDRGRRDTAEWLEANPRGTVQQFRSFIVDQAGAPPTGAALEADHAIVRDTVEARTPAQDAQAVWVDEFGLFPPWEPTSAEYVQRVGRDQAVEGLRTLERAKELTGLLTFPIKDRFVRDRPFMAHADTPLLDGVTHVRGGSFPSGHASLAFAQAAVFSSLMPDKAPSFDELAQQLSFARTYAAAHYPSDIVTGAYVGAAAAAFMLARPDAEIPARERTG